MPASKRGLSDNFSFQRLDAFVFRQSSSGDQSGIFISGKWPGMCSKVKPQPII
jgi:hypothetical protein